ncbi:MAG: patatin-like phospholipase family protein [Prochlorococcaceae cyanobacterium]|jgi:NTE family protein
MADADHPRFSQPLQILQASKSFRDVQASDLEGFTPEVGRIRTGEALFLKGDPADTAYVIEQGILGLYDSVAVHDVPPFRKVVPGDLVGEYGLLCDQPRSASALALTDCTFLRLDRALLHQLLRTHPEVQTTLLREIAEAASRGRPSGHAAIRSVAVLDLQPGGERTGAALAGLRRQLERMSGSAATGGRTITLLEPTGEEECHRQLIDSATDDGIGVFFLQDPRLLSARNRQLIDRLVTVREGNATAPEAGPGEPIRPDLAVRLWPKDTVRPQPAGRPEGSSAQPLHIRPDRPEEMARLARTVLRMHNILVLGGGGARGFAHIGVIAAMEELGRTEIDMVLGVSVGSLIASLYAFNLSAQEIMAHLERVIIHSRPYTIKLPTDSLFTLNNSRRALREFFGPSGIEDSWLPFHVYSTNLSRNSLYRWSRGSIPDAVIASMSVPGIFSPFCDERGDLHVDGGILCNLPIREARQLTNGQVIAISLDALPGEEETATPADAESRSREPRPSLTRTIISSMMCASHADSRAQEHMADLLLRPEISAFSFLEWKYYREIYAVGYEHALQRLGGGLETLKAA